MVSWSRNVIRNSSPEEFLEPTSSRPSSRRSRLSFGVESRLILSKGQDRIVRQGIEFPLGSEFEELNETCGSGDNSLGERQSRRVEPCIRTRDVQVQYVIQQWKYAQEKDISSGSQCFLWPFKRNLSGNRNFADVLSNFYRSSLILCSINDNRKQPNIVFLE